MRQVNAGDRCPAYHAHAALASALASCPGCAGLLRHLGLPSSPGPALPFCPACAGSSGARVCPAPLAGPGPAVLPCLCAGSSGARVCPAPLARPCAPALPVCGLLRCPGLPSSPGPALLSCLCGLLRRPGLPSSPGRPCPDGPTASPLERSRLSASECSTSCSTTSLFREKVAFVDTRL